MGRNFLHSVFETNGEEAMSSALGEYLLERGNSQRDNSQREIEGMIYRAFLKHTPLGRKEDFRKIYRTLHGGDHAYPKNPMSDDHGDTAKDATPVTVGEVVQGTLDYMFDFDYFRFQAKRGQKYRMSVTHETLRATSLGLYGPDGVVGLTRHWESRERVADGPQIVWVSPSLDGYYFAVRNFGGETGTYALTIAPVDD